MFYGKLFNNSSTENVRAKGTEKLTVQISN